MRAVALVAALVALSGCAAVRTAQQQDEWCRDYAGDYSNDEYRRCRERWDRVDQARRMQQ